MTNSNPDAELNRAAKLFLDNGEAGSSEEAIAKLEGASIVVAVGEGVGTNRSAQAALLTVVNAGARTFLGGIYVVGPLADALVMADVPGPKRLAHAVEFYGGRLGEAPPKDAPFLVIGDAEVPPDRTGPVLRITWHRWCARVTSEIDEERLADDSSFPPAAIHAAAKSLAECFQFYFSKNVMATRRTWTTSLYRPDFKDDPLAMAGPTDALLLPTRLWLIGLGHLGQAYLWNLLWLRYPLDQRPYVVLQDVDWVSDATLSTGMMAFKPFRGRSKTRVLCEFLEGAGWTVRLVERKFDASLNVRDDEPRRALSGLDNLDDRALLDQVGFQEVIDAGLGGTASGFMSYQVRVFPSTRPASEVFKRNPQTHNGTAELDRLRQLPGYQTLERKLGCGMVEVAQKAVGAPFVGTAVASLVVAEIVRGTMPGSARFHGVSGSMAGPDAMSASVWINPPVLNLGYIASL